MTGKEKINKMSNEELGKFLQRGSCKICVYSENRCSDLDCSTGIELWLSREVKEDEVKQSN